MKNLKIDSKKWLSSSLRKELTPTERGIWIDLLVLSINSPLMGMIYNKNHKPYRIGELSALLNIDEDLLKNNINSLLSLGYIKRDKDSDCLIIVDWNKYNV